MDVNAVCLAHDQFLKSREVGKIGNVAPIIVPSL